MVKLEKCLGLKEQLCDDKVGTCVHLLLEMLNIIFIAGTVGMSMRIALRGKGGRVEKKPALLRTYTVVRRLASEVQRSYNGGNVGTRCVPEND